MKKLVFSLLAIIIIMPNLFSQQQNNINQKYVEVTGVAFKNVMPDIVYLGITINTADGIINNKNGVEFYEKNMINALKKIGLNTENDLYISNMVISPVKKKDMSTKKVYELKVRDIKKLDEIYSTLEKEKITDVTILKSEISNIKDIKNEVKAEAIKDAKLKAEIMVEAAGAKLGGILYIVDYDRDFTAPIMLRSKNATSADVVNDEAMVNDYDLNFKETAVISSINTRWEIK